MLKTLIVEDHPFSRDTLQELFSTHFSSMIIEGVASGKEAIQKVKSSLPPDLIIMDIRLPDESGLELTKKIKTMNPKVKVLILTGHHYPEYKEAAAQYGADGFLVKGGPSEEILATVKSIFPEAEESSFDERK